ncbi:hypothetical protein WJX84_000386 [Apatococcus fuscideae]|uniref:Uncharacterized protein n=1 Tax=Apatococcus fuscideae TaxID=2026836 RepID=A0AAW1TBX2_9CHLO
MVSLPTARQRSTTGSTTTYTRNGTETSSDRQSRGQGGHGSSDPDAARKAEAAAAALLQELEEEEGIPQAPGREGAGQESQGQLWQRQRFGCSSDRTSARLWRRRAATPAIKATVPEVWPAGAQNSQSLQDSMHAGPAGVTPLSDDCSRLTFTGSSADPSGHTNCCALRDRYEKGWELLRSYYAIFSKLPMTAHSELTTALVFEARENAMPPLLYAGNAIEQTAEAEVLELPT